MPHFYKYMPLLPDFPDFQNSESKLVFICEVILTGGGKYLIINKLHIGWTLYAMSISLNNINWLRHDSVQGEAFLLSITKSALSRRGQHKPEKQLSKQFK
jgi:hypothetical protein